MNGERGRLAFSLLLCTLLIGCAQARAPVEIADGRGPGAPVYVAAGPESDVSPWETSPAVVEAIEAARRYWSGTPHYEEDVLVQSTATGAFTRPGVEQRAVLYRMTVYPRGFPRKGLAVLEDGGLVRNLAFVGLAHDLWTLPDIDGDGRDDLALAGSFGMGGQWTWGVSLAAFREEGRLDDLGHADLYNDVCGAGDPERWGGPTAARLWVVPGSGMRIQRYSRPSCESETWETVGEPEPFTLDRAGETTYTEISRGSE